MWCPKKPGPPHELLALERQLKDDGYRPGRYVAFEVNEPKKRIVSAAPFRDRVVHHALCAVVGPIFEAGFIDLTFANRVGKGTHRAIEVYERYRKRHAHVLRCDIYRYFPSKDLPSSLVQLRIAVWTGVTRDTSRVGPGNFTPSLSQIRT
jgi:retron-type reverse transcriptase